MTSSTAPLGKLKCVVRLNRRVAKQLSVGKAPTNCINNKISYRTPVPKTHLTWLQDAGNEQGQVILS